MDNGNLKISVYSGFAIIAALVLSTYRGLVDPALEGLDGAHHVMDGVFFRDFFTDLPFSNLASYPMDYYQQYPALGFIFWPPLFPFVEGLVMKVFGVSLFAAQFSIFLFALLLVAATYGVTRCFTTGLARVSAIVVLLFWPGLIPYFNTVMREVPMIAMMALTAFVYLEIKKSAEKQKSYLYWLALAILVSAMLYVKQTALILAVAIALDVLISKSFLLKNYRLWIAVVVSVLLTLPLIIFTLKFGKANIAQSIGNNTGLIISHHQSLPRWSLQSLLFYPKAFLSFSGLPLSLLFIGAILYSVSSTLRLKNSLLWLAWLLVFYFLFTYFDNKQERFLSLIAFPCALLIGQMLDGFFKSSLVAYPKNVAVCLVLLGILVFPGATAEYRKIAGVEELVGELSVGSEQGNVAYLGSYRQLFVYYVRLNDQERKAYVIQVDDVFAGDLDVNKVMHDYRIKHLFIESKLSKELKDLSKSIVENGNVKLVTDGRFSVYDKNIDVSLYEYLGPLAEKMKSIELKSKLL